MFPRVRRATDAADSWAAMIVGVRWTLYSSCALAVVIGALAPVAIPLLFGGAFRGAIVPLWILLPGQIAFDVGGTVSQKVMADNRPATVSSALVVAGVVTVVGLAVTVRPWGIVGAAVVTSLSQFVYLAYLSAAVTRHHRVALALSTRTA
jgi:O-antigen/teichoic acid export membrane protein